MKQKFLGLLLGGLTLAVTATAPALAATVSVEVEGVTQTLAPKTVTTPASVNKDGANTCDGNTAIGALDVATGGNWSGSYSYNNYTVETLMGEAHTFGSGAYWTFYVNGNYANDGACGIHVQDGDKVLFYAGDDPFTTGQVGYDEPVLLDAPATVKPGVPFTASVKEATTTFDSSYIGTTAITPSAGATVSGGATAATTGADGASAVTVAAPGPFTLVATQGNRAPARVVGCATTGSDGYCGTTAGIVTPPVAPGAPCVTNGHDGFCGTADKTVAYAAITAVTEGKQYAKGKGPRQLGGTVEKDGSGIADIRLRLTRNDRGACSTYDGKTEKFKAMKKCGATHGTWFSVGTDAAWTYLLPSKLGRGRYVLDVLVVDKAGNKTRQLARGTSRVVFTVA
ncbi:MAG TPA: DUF4430 domain-containing protein [Baekduia sp.]|nr:DUF4430 domain-containing protein [Baekduia sp.]